MQYFMTTQVQPCVNPHPSVLARSLSLSGGDTPFTVLDPAACHPKAPAYTQLPSCFSDSELQSCLTRDTCPLPVAADREGYHGNRHYDWWLSGLRDYINIKNLSERLGVSLSGRQRIFELGCASGRALRHFAVQHPEMESWGADISMRHVEWVRLFLPKHIRIFQNTVLPILPLESGYFDMVCAFSVFTHIDEYELAWLAELRRILRPGGVAYITVHSENTWNDMRPDWPVYQALDSMRNELIGQAFEPDRRSTGLPRPKTVFQWRKGEIYNTNVFHHTDYLRNAWGRFFHNIEIHKRLHDYQDVVLLKK
jgi:SAM-dependent methyltransferase